MLDRLKRLGQSAARRLTAPRTPSPLSGAAMDALYADPRTPPDGPRRVFHLGHSLVGRDMPMMLEQLADAALGPGHAHNSQLGWGTSMKEHWEPGETINGFEGMNDHPRFRPAFEALDSGEYDMAVFTEMIDIRDAVRYHASWDYLTRWTCRARAGRPGIEVFFYESWFKIDHPEGWLTRLDRDLGESWEGGILARTLAMGDLGGPIVMIPAGQAMATFVRALEGQGGLPGLANREGLFTCFPDGRLDPLHINDLGAYLVALVHFAVLYGRTPVGLPHALLRADGTPADAPSPEVARLMQDSAWQAVTAYSRTGVRG